MDDSAVPKFEKQEKTVMIKIPSIEQEGLLNNYVPGFKRHTVPTFNGFLLKVNYELSVFVKHDAWNEFGAGKGVTLPIKIHEEPG